MDWSDLVQDGEVASSCERGNAPSGSARSREFLDWGTVHFSGRILLHRMIMLA